MLEENDRKPTESPHHTANTGWLSPPLLQLLLRRVLRTVMVGVSLLTLVMVGLGHRRTTHSRSTATKTRAQPAAPVKNGR